MVPFIMMKAYRLFSLIVLFQAFCLLLVGMNSCRMLPAMQLNWRSQRDATYSACFKGSVVQDSEPRFEVFKSQSGRKFVAGVVTLRQTLRSKLGPFKKAWKEAWPGLNIRSYVGFRNSVALRGMGNLATVYQLCIDALRLQADFDYLLVFEDDGIPYSGTMWPRDLDQILDHFDRKNGSGLLLGGHAFKGYKKSRIQKLVTSKGPRVARVSEAFGAYGMLIPKKFLKHLACRYEAILALKSSEQFTSDVENWILWNNLGGGGYVAAPLLVNHNAQSYSFTWGKYRPLLIRRDFWNYDD